MTLSRKSILNRALSILMTAALLFGIICTAPVSLNVKAASMPTVTYQGLKLDSRTTNDEHLPLLVSNADGRDFDFFPDTTEMAKGNTWFEYDYGNTVHFTDVEMTGWWPKEQAVNKVSFQYYDGEWKDSDQDVVPKWTVSGSGGPQTLKIALSAPVNGSKFRIKILGSNTAWSAKCCMRLLAPVTSDTARLKLADALEKANKAKTEAVVGSNAGEYPKEAYDTFVKAIDQAQAILDAGTATAEEYEAAAAGLVTAQTAFEKTVIIAGKLSEPEVTLINLNAQSGSPQLLVNNPGRGDFDFGPGGSNMTAKNAYVEYNYIDIVKINAVDLIGWWPKDQGVKNLSFEYFEDGAWKAADQDITVAWKTPANTGKEESLTIELSAPVTTTKFRIKINSSYTSWGSGKINMRLMEPKGEIIRSIKPLYDAVRAAQEYVSSVLVGNKPGEFPQSAVDALQVVVDEAIAKLDNPNLTEDELKEQIRIVEAAKEQFIKSQNPVSDVPAVTAGGLTLKGGSLGCLTDGQVATQTIFEENGKLENAYIEFDYGTSAFRLNEISILAATPKQTAPTIISVLYEENGEWKAAAENVKLEWKGNIPNVEGRNVTLSSPVSASKFRLVISSTNTAQSECRVNEILLKGRIAADTAKLNSIVSEAQELLKNSYPDASDLMDILAISLAQTKDASLLSRASQSTIDAMQADLQSAVDAVKAYAAGQVRNQLIARLAEAKAIMKGDYTAESYAALESAINAAQAVLDDANATDEQMTAQVKALLTAMSRLQPADVKKGTLYAVIQLANAYVANGDVDKLVPSAKEKFNSALKNAQDAYTSTGATQEQVDKAWKDLMKAIQGMSFVPGVKTTLIELAAKANAIDVKAYLDGSEKDAFILARNEANALISDLDAMQADIDAAYTKLDEAMKALIPLPDTGDKTELKKVIAEANTYDLTKYVDDSNKTNFTKTLADAKELCDNNDKATQSQIDAMRQELLSAMESLRLRADKSVLNDWLDKFKDLDLSNYSEQDAAAVRALIAEGDALTAQDLGTDEAALIESLVVRMQALYESLEEEAPSSSNDSSKPESNPSSDTSSDADVSSSNSSTSSSSDKTPTTGDGAFPVFPAAALLLVCAGGAVLLLKKKSER